MNPPSRMEQQIRWWLWLVPAWLRSTRGEEIVTTVLALVPPDTTRLPWRSRLDLIRAGLAARRRGTPPLATWLTVVWAEPRYRTGHIDPRWRPWLASRLPARTFTWWCALLRVVPIMGPAYVVSRPAAHLGDHLAFIWAVYFGAALLTVLLFVGLKGPSWRRTLAAKNAIDLATGQVLHDVRWGSYPPRCRNVVLGPSAAAMTVISGPVAMALATRDDTAAMRSGGPVVAAALLLVAGVPAAVLLRRTRGTKRSHPAAVARVRPVVAFAVGASLGIGVALGEFGQFLVDPVILGAATSFAGVALLTISLLVGRRRAAPVGIWELVRFLGPVPRPILAGEAPT